MTEASNKPRVFVSSTILDFRDLRSALKFWLEEMGLDVRMSEFNDFERRPEQGTLESCLSAIEDCDYFILLIGGRRGSPFIDDESSVTREEYRTAASLQDQGKIKLVVFVRREVQTAIDERKALRAGGGASAEPVGVPSSVVEDPAFVEGFLDEIASRQVTREGEGPSGATWIYPFETFAELVAALRINLRLSRSMRRQGLLANLKWEVEDSIAALVHKTKGDLPFAASLWLSHLRQKIELTHEIVEGSVRLSSEDAQRVAAFWISLPEAGRLRTVALREALLSGEFLEYDPSLGTLRPGLVYMAMQRLLTAANLYGDLQRDLRSDVEGWDELVYAVRQKQAQVELPGHRLALLFRVHDVMDDALRLLVALERYIVDPASELRLPGPNPPTPILSEVPAIEAELPSHDDVERWTADAQVWGWLDRGARLTADDVATLQEHYPHARQLLERPAAQLAQEFAERKERDGLNVALTWLASGECTRTKRDRDEP